MARGKFEKKPEPKFKKPASGGSKTNKILLRVMIVLLSVLLVLLIVAAVAMNYVFGKIGRYDKEDASLAPVCQACLLWNAMHRNHSVCAPSLASFC